jgi:hypothetical protein
VSFVINHFALLALLLAVQLLPASQSSTGWTALKVPSTGKTGFKQLPPSVAGILFTNTLSEEAAAAHRVLETGSGVAAGDVDGDGRVDLLFCSLSGQCRLYRNTGELRFQDVTASSGIQCHGSICRGAVFADVNGDGLLDLLISTTGRGVLFFRNRGEGKFEEATAYAGTGSPFASMTIAMADVDGNGTLDFYVTNYRTNDVRDAGRVDLQSINGRTVVPPALQNRFILVEGKVQEYGEPDLLYTNEGSGRFKPASWVQGRFRDENDKPLTRAPLDWGLSAAFRDLNGDSHPDLYVCNDYWTPDRIWMNDGKGGFKALSTAAVRHTSASSMGVDFADINQDGFLDFFVVDMLARSAVERLQQMPAYTGPPQVIGEIFDRPQVNRNTLFLNRGDATFEEIAEFSGVEASEWSWQPLFLDVDLDGYEDLLIASGHTKNVQDFDVNETVERIRPKWPLNEPIVTYNGAKMPFQTAFTQERIRQLRLYRDYSSRVFAFRNSGSLEFEDKTVDWGFTNAAIHHGIASADLDNDGDLDLVVITLNSAAKIWINESSAPRLAVQLRGKPPNTDAIGAKVRVLGGAVPQQSQEVTAGGKYLSCSQRRLTFAAGVNAADSMEIQVHWRSGLKTVVRDAQANRLYDILEAPSQ